MQSQRMVVVGAGPVGSAVARRAAEQGSAVAVVTRSGGGPDIDGVRLIALDERYVERIRALNAIATHHDPHLSPEGLAQWQREKVEQWRASTAQITPSVPPVPERSTVLGALRPGGADDIALHAREREKVAALVGAARSIESIIASADRTRLAAILDGLETSEDVLSSSQGDAILGERTDAVFARLAEIDDDARAIAEAETAAAPGQAWQQMFAETVENGVAGVAAKSALYRSDAAAYDLVASAEREIDAAAIERVLRSIG